MVQTVIPRLRPRVERRLGCITVGAGPSLGRLGSCSQRCEKAPICSATPEIQPMQVPQTFWNVAVLQQNGEQERLALWNFVGYPVCKAKLLLNVAPLGDRGA